MALLTEAAVCRSCSRPDVPRRAGLKARWRRRACCTGVGGMAGAGAAAYDGQRDQHRRSRACPTARTVSGGWSSQREKPPSASEVDCSDDDGDDGRLAHGLSHNDCASVVWACVVVTVGEFHAPLRRRRCRLLLLSPSDSPSDSASSSSAPASSSSSASISSADGSTSRLCVSDEGEDRIAIDGIDLEVSRPELCAELSDDALLGREDVLLFAADLGDNGEGGGVEMDSVSKGGV